jgi:redox-sensitive bicupin YhaK (pirin superfamily)
LLLDYAGPREFPPTSKRLGVGEYPHRGFETVTIVLKAKWNTGTLPAAAGASAQAMCNE